MLVEKKSRKLERKLEEILHKLDRNSVIKEKTSYKKSKIKESVQDPPDIRYIDRIKKPLQIQMKLALRRADDRVDTLNDQLSLREKENNPDIPVPSHDNTTMISDLEEGQSTLSMPNEVNQLLDGNSAPSDNQMDYKKINYHMEVQRDEDDTKE